jgi:TPR repeat protein
VRDQLPSVAELVRRGQAALANQKTQLGRQYFIAAATQNSPRAYYLLAQSFTARAEQASRLRYLEEAARLQHRPAIEKLIEIYSEGNPLTNPNWHDVRARKWQEALADVGKTSAEIIPLRQLPRRSTAAAHTTPVNAAATPRG